jgi:hypothetical protein
VSHAHLDNTRPLKVRFTFRAGHYLNFDLAFPSAAIPNEFFPSDVNTYGTRISLAISRLFAHFPRALGYKVCSIPSFHVLGADCALLGLWGLEYKL